MVATEIFEEKKFSRSSKYLIGCCRAILERYAEQGYDLTLRQLYYQLVAHDLIRNHQKEYTRLGSIVNKARLAGHLDWDTIVDRGRGTVRSATWRSPGEMVDQAAEAFQIDKWADQDYHVEVMVEKQALEGVLAPVCAEYQVGFTSNKGYSSQSFMYRKGAEIRARRHKGKLPVVLYLGDHDPSGLDMDRDVRQRLEMFSRGPVYVERVALTFEQIKEFEPPPNPAKITDSRATEYIKEHGGHSWELDALEPRVLEELVGKYIVAVLDEKKWNAAVEKEESMRGMIRKAAENMQDILGFNFGH